MAILYSMIDKAEGLLSLVSRKPKPAPSYERMKYQAFEYYDLITGRHDIASKVPSRFLEVPAEEEEDAASLGAQKVDGVWTVPEGMSLEPYAMWWPPVPEDLVDKTPRNIVTKNGDPIEGYIKPNDLIRGDDSVATPLMYGMLPVIAGFAYFLSTMSGGLGVLALLLATPFLITIAQGEGVGDAIKSAIMLLLGPFVLAKGVVGTGLLSEIRIGSMVWQALKSGSIENMIALVMSLGSLLGGLFIAGLVLSLVLTFMDSKRKSSVIGAGAEGGFWLTLRNNIKWTLLTVVVVSLCVVLLPAPMVPFALFFMASLYPMIHTESNFNARTKELQTLGNTFRLGRMGALSKVHVKPRLAQAKRAYEDKSPLITIGTATGWLTAKQYQFAPDEGQAMKLSVVDFMKHLLVFGMTGIGKTASMMRPIAKQWTEESGGGFLCLCGKGALPSEISALIEIMIRPGVDFAPIQGLDANGVATALNAIQVDKSKGGENADIWDSGAKNFIDHLTVLHEALRDHEKFMLGYSSDTARKMEQDAQWWMLEAVKLRKQGLDDAEAQAKSMKLLERRDHWLSQSQTKRQWLWNIDTLEWLKNLCNQVRETSNGPSAGADLLKALSYLGYRADAERADKQPASIHPDIGNGSLLDGTIEFFTNVWPRTDEKQRSSFMINVDLRLQPLTRGKYLVGKNGVHWKMLEEGEDVAACLYGKSVGVDLPVVDHGEAALAITTLVKQRVYNDVKRRATRSTAEWKGEGQTPLMIMIDEGHLILGQPEADLLTIARSLELSFVVATQMFENLVGRFNNELNSAIKFADYFQSVVCMESSIGTYNYMRNRLGKADLVSFKSRAHGLDYLAGLKNFALSPLNDPTHPNRSGMERLLKLGFGKPVVREPTQPMAYAGGRLGLRTRQLDESTMMTEISVPTGGQIETLELFEEQEFTSLLTTGQAIVFLNRAGARRVDLATFGFIGPDELRKPAPKVEEPA